MKSATRKKSSHKKPSSDLARDLPMNLPKASLKGSLADKRLALQLCTSLEEKKASRIILLDLHKINSYFSYFLIASANSVPHLNALSQEISKGFTKNIKNMKNARVDLNISIENQNIPNQNIPMGDSHSGWVVLDLIDIVVHLFLEEQRSFYNLERLWGDADIIYPKGAAKALSYAR